MHKLAGVLLVASLVLPTSSRADLFWDGAPNDVGRQVANAAAAFTNGISAFFGAISTWEQIEIDGQSVGVGARTERSSALYKQFIDSIEQSISILKSIHADFSDLLINFDKEITEKLRDIEATTILSNNGYQEPKTYGELIDIALNECFRMRGAAGSLEEWNSSLDSKRKIAITVSNQIHNSLNTGLVISIYSQYVAKQ